MDTATLLRCPYCKSDALVSEPEAYRCTTCAVRFPIEHGVINMLIKPDAEVVRELEGMLAEAHEKGETWTKIEELIVRRVPHVTTQQEREDGLRHLPKNYYRSTRLNIEQAMGLVDLSSGQNVLEIGGENEFPFLKMFQDRGMNCCVTNIHFSYDDPANFSPWTTKVAGDMNALPFRDQSFDIVLMSATSHHSPDLPTTIKELARVTRPGGIIFILNDPVHGLLKHLREKLTGGKEFRKGVGRVELIHENEFTVGSYRAAFRKNNLRLVASMFPAYYDEKLTAGDVSGVRWASVARLVSVMWRIQPLRNILKRAGLPIGQRLLGMEMNVILEKRANL